MTETGLQKAAKCGELTPFLKADPGGKAREWGFPIQALYNPKALKSQEGLL